MAKSEKTDSYCYPKYLKKIIAEKIHPITDTDERAKIFLQELFVRKVSLKIAKKYFNIAKMQLFPNTNYTINSKVFDIWSTGNRSDNFSFEHMQLVFSYIKQKYRINSGLLPIIMSYFTALRINEVVSLRISHLVDLKNGNKNIRLPRKYDSVWNVQYYSEFDDFIRYLYEKNEQRCSLYLNSGVNDRLFDTNARIIRYTLKKIYTIVCNTNPPVGFGLHIVRYYKATKLFEENELLAAKSLLGHNKLKTTLKYVKNNEVCLQKELDDINNKADLYKKILSDS